MSPAGGKTIKFDDVLMYLALGRKHARLIVLSFCFSMLAGLVLYTFSRPVYYARSSVRYQVTERSPTADQVFQFSSDHTVLMQLSSPHIIERTAKRLGIVASSREIELKYLKKISVRFDSENNIEVEVWAYSYPWARDWAEAMVKEYLLYRDEKRIEHSEVVIKSFAGEMGELKQKMDDTLNKRQDFDETNEMTELLIDLNQLKEVPEEMAIAEHRLAVMDRTRETLQDTNLDTIAKLSLLTPPDNDVQLSLGQVVPGQLISGQNGMDRSASNVVVVPSLVASSTKTWEELDKQKRELEISLRETGRIFLPGNVKMKAIQKQLDEVNHLLETELESARDRFDVDYASMTDQLRQLRLKLPEYEETNRRHERMIQNFDNYNSGQLAWQNLYSDMATKITAWDFSADKERAQLQYMGHVEISDEPVSPRRLKVFLYSLGMALALGIGLPSLIEFLDNSISDVDKAEETLHIRGMGVVPRITEDQMDSPLLFNMNAKSGHHLKEIFRTIRTNLTLNTDKSAVPQIILVTSAMPQEGKTLVSSNLALSFAQNGEKTLLIDCDLRRGRLHRLFACENRPGLSEMLTERKTLEESCHQSFHENLTVLTCGRHISDGGELLSAADFTKLIQELRQKYQRIVLDTPPVLGLSDTSVLQVFADGVLMVIWSGHTPLPTIRAAVETLQANGSKFFGFVLNRLDFSASANSYKYFYYSYNYYENYQIAEKV